MKNEAMDRNEVGINRSRVNGLQSCLLSLAKFGALWSGLQPDTIALFAFIVYIEYIVNFVETKPKQTIIYSIQYYLTFSGPFEGFSVYIIVYFGLL